MKKYKQWAKFGAQAGVLSLAFIGSAAFAAGEVQGMIDNIDLTDALLALTGGGAALLAFNAIKYGVMSIISMFRRPG